MSHPYAAAAEAGKEASHSPGKVLSFTLLGTHALVILFLLAPSWLLLALHSLDVVIRSSSFVIMIIVENTALSSSTTAAKHQGTCHDRHPPKLTMSSHQTLLPCFPAPQRAHTYPLFFPACIPEIHPVPLSAGNEPTPQATATHIHVSEGSVSSCSSPGVPTHPQ